MSSINGLGSNLPIHKVISSPVQKQLPPQAARAAGVDKLELSGMSHLLHALKSNDIRGEKVAAIKAQIEAGTYETPDKLDAAVDRLLDDLG